MFLLSQPIAKKLVAATGAQEYNILQNNGRGAHQEVDHVSGLKCQW
jgi:diadenosine tetraphosphate (Ap4A) HIT family hydrolase